MIKKTSQFSNDLADREAIRECLYLYCRAVDTQDEQLLQEVYWPGAIDDHIQFYGPKEEYAAWVLPRIAALDYIKHMIMNIIIDIDGSKADVESYYQSISGATKMSGEKINIVSLGTYKDRFERRGDEWRIASRLVMLTPVSPTSTTLSFGFLASQPVMPGD